MTLIPYKEANSIPKPGSYKVDWSGGTFDVAAALKTGRGQFTVDDSTQADLVVQLAKFPGVYRADGSGPSKIKSYGLLANRPSVSSVLDEFTYYATDDNGGVLYQVQSGAWTALAPRGLELGSSEITSSQSSTNGTAPGTPVPGFTTTVTVKSRPILVRLDCPILQNATAGQGSTAYIVQDGTTQVALANVFSPTANRGASASCERRLPLAPGVYTFAVYLVVATSGTATIVASSTTPALLEVVEI